MNYGIRNIHFDYESSEIEGTAEVGKMVTNFRRHAGSGSWEAWIEGEYNATVVFHPVRNKALRAARKAHWHAHRVAA